MRKNFGVEPYTYVQPVYIIATYDEDGIPNAMNAAWGGLSESNRISFCISAGHKTIANVMETKAFTVSMGNTKNVVACDYVGIISGNKERDKFAKAGFHATKSEFVNAPLIDELPMALDCKLVSYDRETETLIGEIVNVNADESILDSDGKIDPQKFMPIIYDPVNHTYLEIGKKVGNAFSDGKALCK